MTLTARSTPMETALLTKIGRLPVNIHKAKRLRRFNFSRSHVLCWYHSVARGGRRYTMQCNALEEAASRQVV